MEVLSLKNYNVKHDKRDKAVKMFLAGVTKENVCSKLGITENIFDEWIDCNDFMRFRKNTAFRMFVAGVPKVEICRRLGIGEKKLNKWIDEGYKQEQMAAIAISQYKSGLSPWITEICTENKGITFMN